MSLLHRARPLLALAALALPPARGAEDEAMPVPASIAATDVPPVPASIARELARYQEIRSASYQDWAATPEPAMLISTRFAATNQIHLVRMPGGDRSQVTFEPDRVLGSAARPGHPQFSFSEDAGGAENFQVFLAGLDGGVPVRLTDGKSRNTDPKWSNSGRLLAYSGNARDGRDMDIYVVDPADPASARLVKAVSGEWTVADWSPDDRSLAAVEYISINESYVHIIDVASGDVRTVTPRHEGDRVAYQDVKFSADGKSLYWTTDLGSEFLRLARFDLSGGGSQTLTEGIDWDVEAFDLSDDGALIALVANEDGISRLHVLDARTGAERPAPELPRGVLGGLTFRPGTHLLGFTLSSARSPSDAYSLDPDSGQLARWTSSETAGFDVATFPEPELIHFSTFDGREIPAFVYRPPAETFPGPRPVLLNIHGGPEGQFRPAFLGRANYLVNELGIAVIFPNVRGSSGYGKSYLLLDNGMKRDESVRDIGALLDWIATRDEFDSNRVGVTGGSYGGFMSLAVQTTYADRIKAGIDIVGISNFVTFLQNTQEYRRDLRRAEYGDERDPEMRSYLERVSPLTNAAKLKNPLLVVQGKNDPRVPITEAEQIVAKVRGSGVPVWYVVGLDEGHGFAKRANQDYLQAVEVMFLRKYLIGD
jgi:dipeptidyl aminopeptidase/acylaminoacyl peptidase